MKTYIADLIPRIQRFSQRLDNLTLLTNQHWVVLDELTSAKNVFIFRSNNELLISRNGSVRRGKWEYLGHNSILIDQGDESRLYRHGFFDENILALKVDSMNEYALLVNESKYDGELNSVDRVLDFLSAKYLNSTIIKQIQEHTETDYSVELNYDEKELKNPDHKEVHISDLEIIIIILAFALLNGIMMLVEV